MTPDGASVIYRWSCTNEHRLHRHFVYRLQSSLHVNQTLSSTYALQQRVPAHLACFTRSWLCDLDLVGN